MAQTERVYLQCSRPGPIPGSERGPKKGKATHSNTLAWRIPWTEEPGGLQSMGSPRVGHDWATNCFLFTQGTHSAVEPGTQASRLLGHHVLCSAGKPSTSPCPGQPPIFCSRINSWVTQKSRKPESNVITWASSLSWSPVISTKDRSLPTGQVFFRVFC